MVIATIAVGFVVVAVVVVKVVVVGVVRSMAVQPQLLDTHASSVSWSSQGIGVPISKQVPP